MATSDISNHVLKRGVLRLALCFTFTYNLHAYSTHSSPSCYKACQMDSVCMCAVPSSLQTPPPPGSSPWGPPPEVTLTQYAPLCVTLVQSFARTSRICLQDLPGTVSVAPMEGVSLGRGGEGEGEGRGGVIAVCCLCHCLLYT